MRYAFAVTLLIGLSAGPIAPAASQFPNGTASLPDTAEARAARAIGPRRKAGRALLIGIDSYHNPKLDLVGGSSEDVGLMQELLTRHLGYRADEIQVLIDAEATRTRILEAVDAWLVAGTAPGDRVLFYFSGHGYFQNDEDGDETDPYDEVLVAHDASLVDGSTSPARVANLIADDDLGARLERLSNREVMLIVDACHSGTMTRDLGGSDPRLVRTIAPRLPAITRQATRSAIRGHQEDRAFIAGRANLVAWSAVSPRQQALVDIETPTYQGVFTGRFQRGLAERAADRNGDHLVTYAELHDYLQRESEAYCERHRKECPAGLTPYLEAPPDRLARDLLTGQPVAGPAILAASLLAHDNRAGLAIEILPAARVRLGREMAFRVTTAESGHLLVLDVDAAGRLTQLFPNRFAEAGGKDNRIGPGNPVLIPDAYYGFRFTAGEPAGQGLLLAILTRDPISLDDLLGPNKDLDAVADPSAYLATLARRLRLPWSEDAGNRTASWSMVAAEYWIDP